MPQQALFSLKVIKPKRKVAAHLQANLMKAIEATTKAIRQDMDSVTATWTAKTKPTDWTNGSARIKGGDLVGEVTTASKIFFWLDEGTKTRRAVMFQPFAPKTAVHNLVSGAGQRTYSKRGFYKMVGKRVPQTPGIEAREFSKTIAKKHTPTLEKNVRKAIKDSGL